MSISRKVVSAGLALLIAATAVAGASTCPRGLALMSSSDHAMALMPMPMPGMDSSLLGFSENRTDLCCQVSPAELPKQTQVSSNAVNVVFVAAHAPIRVSGANKLAALTTQARTLGPPPQALLCVFLI